jgi:hypothetical protein
MMEEHGVGVIRETRMSTRTLARLDFVFLKNLKFRVQVHYNYVLRLFVIFMIKITTPYKHIYIL